MMHEAVWILFEFINLVSFLHTCVLSIEHETSSRVNKPRKSKRSLQPKFGKNRVVRFLRSATSAEGARTKKRIYVAEHASD